MRWRPGALPGQLAAGTRPPGGGAVGAVSPDDHQVKAQIVADREAAWLAALEAEAMQPGVWGLTGDPDDPEATGALDGHPASDEGAQRAWIALNPDDETFCN